MKVYDKTSLRTINEGQNGKRNLIKHKSFKSDIKTDDKKRNN